MKILDDKGRLFGKVNMKLDWIDKLILWIFYATIIGAITVFLTYRTLDNMAHSKYENEIAYKENRIIGLYEANKDLEGRMFKMQKIINEYEYRYGRLYGFKYPDDSDF